MWGSSVRLPFLAAAATAALLLLFLSNGLDMGPRIALATHAGGADAFLIDMDPTGNMATGVASIQTCGRINPNGVQDADEDGVDSINVDVVTGPEGIPAGNPMIAFYYELAYPPGMQVIGADNHFLLSNNAGSSIITPPVHLPDSDGLFVGESADTSDWSVIPPEFGRGVLSRLTLRGTSSMASGIAELELRTPVHIDSTNTSHLSDNASIGFVVPGATLAVGVPCPPALDISAVSAATTVPAGVDSGAAFQVTVTGEVRNSSAAPADAEAFIFLDGPSQCVVDNPDRETAFTLPALASSTLPVQTYKARCFRPGTASFFGRVGVKLHNSTAPESNPFNNATFSVPAAVDVRPVSSPVDFSASSGKLYISDVFDGAIIRSDPSGANQVTVFYRPGSYPQAMAPDLYGGKLYWGSGYSLRRMNFDGSGEEEVNPDFFLMDDDTAHGHLYGYGNLSGYITRVNSDGTGLTRVVHPGGAPKDVAVDEPNGKIYWADSSLHRANLDGTGLEDLPGRGVGTITIDQIHGKLYWSEYQLGYKIRRANLDGSQPEDVLSAPGGVSDIAIDPIGGLLFWTSSGKVWRASLDGSRVTQIASRAGGEIVHELHVKWVPPDDGDGVGSPSDNCPATFNPNQTDLDRDSVGDACDGCPLTPAGALVDSFGCSLAQVDADGDGVCNDNAPSNGPWPGCVRSVAVGGIVGLLDHAGEAAEPPRQERGSSAPPALPIAAAAGVAALTLGTYLRRRRRT
ncbi:MAG TPA: hypothetical protein VLS25_01695 [Dehalococcoidia bacterium]|nr:hypothetical protein [Dehalococcoidia bacterium]